MLKAVIFDLDGTIILNNEAYDIAFSTVLGELGAKVDSGFRHTGGIGVKNNWKALISHYGLSEDLSLDDLEKRTQKVYLDNIKKIKLREGFESLITDLKAHSLKLALATGNDKETTEAILNYFNIDNIFDAMATIYEAGKPKPEPDIFLLAAKRLAVEPAACVVIEDSDAGIEAAKRANMEVVSVHKLPFIDLSAEKLQSMVQNV